MKELFVTHETKTIGIRLQCQETLKLNNTHLRDYLKHKRHPKSEIEDGGTEVLVVFDSKKRGYSYLQKSFFQRNPKWENQKLKGRRNRTFRKRSNSRETINY